MNVIQRQKPTVTQKLTYFWSKGRSNWLLGAFVLLMAWPFLYLMTSFTFYVFILIGLSLSNFQLPLFKAGNYGDRMLLLFGGIVFLSAIFAPSIDRGQSQLSTLIILLQYSYWVILACFIITHAPFISFYTISKIAFIGLTLYTLNFFVFNNLFNLPPIRLYVNRNAYVFTMVSLFPITTYFVYKKGGKALLLLYLFWALLLMLLTNGRSAGILVIFESLLVWAVFFRKSYVIIRALLITCIPFAVLMVSDISFSASIRNRLGNRVEVLSPRFGELIKGEGLAGDLSFDESWLTRELMIEKALEINQKYPLLGIGPFNFSRYDAVLANSVSSKYDRLYISALGLDYYNKKSSHNTYIMILAENGYLGLISFLLLALPLWVYFFKLLFFKSFNIDALPIISFVAISIYFYVISTTGTITYFVIGLAYASYYKRIRV